MELKLNNIEKEFGSLRVLKGISAEIQSGQKVALIGPNGSGKTTLIRIAMGLLNFRGEVLLNGHSIRKNREELTKKVAYLPQNPPLLKATVGEIAEVTASLREIPLTEIEELSSKLALDIREIWNRPLAALSGGMKQKFLISLALSHPAELLILDEPTASLDPESRDRFFRIYEEKFSKSTLLLCSHRLEEILQLVDYLMVLDEGELSFFGPVEEYLNRYSAAVIELFTRGEESREKLKELGFSEIRSHRWSRVVSRSEKVSILQKLSELSEDIIENISIRDVEYLSIEYHQPLKREREDERE